MDFITDNNPKNINYVKSLLGDLPSYVKSATYVEKPRVARGSFANTVDRELPIDNAEHTFMSYAYLKAATVGKKLEHNEEVYLNKIKQAAQMHGNAADLENIDKAITQKEEENHSK